MQGIFINGVRPKSKKAIKEAIKDPAQHVRLEATSLYGDEYDGTPEMAPHGTYLFVGPDPYTKRNFYGKIVVDEKGIRVL